MIRRKNKVILTNEWIKILYLSWFSGSNKGILMWYFYLNLFVFSVLKQFDIIYTGFL